MGTMIGFAHESPDSVTVTSCVAAPTAPWESVTLKVTGKRPARSKRCVADVLPGVSAQLSANDHRQAVASPSAPLKVAAKVSCVPLVTVCATSGEAIVAAGG